MSMLDMSRTNRIARTGYSRRRAEAYCSVMSTKSAVGGISLDGSLQKKYIPMTETTYYTLLSVVTPRHGYAIMQYVSELTKGRIVLGTGTLYTMVGRLVADGVIVTVPNPEGKKAYQVTEAGLELLKMETERLEKQLTDGRNVLTQGVQ